MTSYEFDILRIRLDIQEKQISCLTKQLNACCGATTPIPGCTGITITAQPQGGTVSAGNNLTLSVSVTGDSPITFQWKKAGVAIQGATSSSYSIVNATSLMAGSYSVMVTNPCGGITSGAANIVVNTPVQTILVYSGWTDSSSITSINQITSLQNSGQYAPGTDISVDFTANTQPKYLVMAEPISEPLKTKWYGGPLNNGNIGTNGVFPTPTVVGGYRVYITAYLTQQTQTPIVFKIS